MSTLRTAASVAAILLRAAAGACEAFARHLVQPTVPDVIPDWVDDGSATW
jgi:hypothetical protein